MSFDGRLREFIYEDNNLSGPSNNMLTNKVNSWLTSQDPYMPIDCFGEIYSYMTSKEQSKLFAASKKTVNRFITATINEEFIRTSLIYNKMLYPCSYNKNIVPQNCCFIINYELMQMKNYFCAEFNCEEIYIQKADKIKEIGDDWMYGCFFLEKFNIDGFTSLTTVGNNWMYACSSLTEINTSGLESLISVGDWWMGICQLLEKFTTDGLTSLNKVGKGWLIGCKSLKEFNTDGLASLTRVGNSWMNSCGSLKKINTDNLLNLPLNMYPEMYKNN